ncbi:glycosyl transferase family 1 [Aureimonas populi]|uniref:Glycosyl transferase family 1 n=1 Tax=Aureimonas populi TaxID=1701758 RepID=A0ABW5CTE3_9HYPH|nr:glycosyl transferase family 1 [Aureimonas populi]
MTKILYLVHDLCDPAVRRRVAMLHAGGAQVLLAGFRRGTDSAVPDELDHAPVVLGETKDGAFGQRIAKVAAALLSGELKHLAAFAPAVILARNLEMLALGERIAGSIRPRPRLIYETLDIHRLLLDQGMAGLALRALERRLAARTAFVLTSSPAFVDNYLRPVQGFEDIRLQENKVLDLEEARPPLRDADTGSRNPIRIGWFGALRCARSLSILSRLAEDGEGSLEVTLRGRPARREFEDFDAQVSGRPHLSFHGPYRAEDLVEIYGAVDLVWAIDFFEQGLNSDWLLPNRVYEGCAHGAVPIALAGTQTAGFLRERGIGIICDDLSPEALARQLREVDIAALKAAVRALAPETFRSGRAECRKLVAALAGAPDAPSHRAEAA